MKKIIIIFLTLGLSISLIACDGNKTADNSTESQTQTPATSEVSSEAENQTDDNTASEADTSIAQILCDEFASKLNENPSITASELAETISQNPVLTIEPMVVPVQPGLLMGFDNAEITGFSEGYMFAPMIGSIPFVGYVFEADSEEAALALEALLKESANLRWVVCTEADELASQVCGQKVLFVMSPKSFEEDAALDEGL